MNIFAILDFISIFIAVYLGTLIISRDSSGKLNRLFFINNLIVAYTAFCEYFRLTAETEYWAFIWFKASILIPFFPVILLKFALIHTNNKLNKNKYFNFILYFFAFIIIVLFSSTDLLYDGLVKEWYGWDVIIRSGIFAHFIGLYFSLTGFTSIFILVRYLISLKEKSQKITTTYMLIGLSTPFLFALILNVVIRPLGYKIPPTESISYLIGTVFLAIGLIKLDFFVVDPLDTIKKLFASIGDYILLVNRNGEIILASDSFISCSIYSKDEIIGNNISYFFQITGDEIELLIKTKTNYLIPVSTISSAINDNNKKDDFFIVVSRDLRERKNYEQKLLSINLDLEEKVKEKSHDLINKNLALAIEINDRKKTEDELRKSEQRYKDVIENATEIIYLTNNAGHIIYVNDAAIKSSGYNIEEINTKNYYDFIHPDYRNKIKRAYLRQVISKKQKTLLEFPIITRSGKTIWWSQSASIILDNGKFSGFQVIARDITDRILAQIALKNSEEKYRKIFDSAPVGIYQSYMNGELRISNLTSAKILGYETVEELLKVNLNNIYYDKNERKRIINKYNSIGSGFEDSVKWKKKDGTTILVQLSSHAIKDELGETKYFEGFITDITDKIKTDEKLQLLAEAIKSTGEGISITDLNNRIIFVNKTFIELFGYSEEELIGNTIDMLRVEKPYENSVEDIRIKTIKEGWTGELLNRKKNGTIFPISLSTSSVVDESGEVYALIGITKDITEIKQTQDKLLESEERYRNIFEHTSAVMLLINPKDGSIKGANNAACKYYGYEKSKFLNMNISDIQVNSNVSLTNKSSNKNEKQFKNVLYDRHQISNGNKRDVEIHSGTIAIQKKEIIFAIVQDITERIKAKKQLEDYKNHLEILVNERTQKLDIVNQQLKQEITKLKIAEENIQNQLSFLQTLIDTIPNPIFICDANKIYDGCNKAFEIFHGITNEELRGKNVYQLTNKEIAKFHDAKDDDLLKNRGNQKFETIIYDTEGIEHNALVYKAVFDKADGSIGGIVGILLDITEIKKLEKDISSALEKEKELNNLKSRFISVASHEFRTPLTTILASADLLDLYGKKWPEEKYYEYIKLIQNSVEYMTELLNDVLTVSKSEEGIIENNPVEINLYDLIFNIFENAKLSSPIKNQFTFEYKIEQKIFYFDNKLLTQIISNLVSNAIKYSPDGGEISLEVFKNNNFLNILVRDNGIGIPKEDQLRLFEPFHRAKNVGTISGTGLGLSIAFNSAKIMGGNLSVESKINKGTKFNLELSLNDNNN